MTQDSYTAALEAAKIELAEALVELNQAQQKAQGLGIRIADLRQSVTVLSKLCGEEHVQIEDTLGLTDTIRKVFQDGCNRDFTVHDVRQQLQAIGFPVSKYGNLLASIHVVVGRLAENREIIQTSKVGNDRPSYRWGFKMDPLPKSRLSWEPVYESGMRGDEKPKSLTHSFKPGTYVENRAVLDGGKKK
jgi:hypothetical protein